MWSDYSRRRRRRWAAERAREQCRRLRVRAGREHNRGAVPPPFRHQCAWNDAGAQQAIKHFPKEGGSIVNISSIASESPVPNSSLYAASKGAVDTLTLALAKELGPRKIRVNAVAPGYTDTEGNQRIGFVGSAAAEAMITATPLGARFGKPEEIAPAVVFLASDDAAWLTGERLNASGGVH